MALTKDNIIYYKLKLHELIKDAGDNGIEIEFHIKEASIKNKITKEEIHVRDRRFKDYEYIRY